MKLTCELSSDPTTILMMSLVIVLLLEKTEAEKLKTQISLKTSVQLEARQLEYEFNIKLLEVKKKEAFQNEFPLMQPEKRQQIEFANAAAIDILKNDSFANYYCRDCQEWYDYGKHSVCWSTIENDHNHCQLKSHNILKTIIQNGVKEKIPM